MTTSPNPPSDDELYELVYGPTPTALPVPENETDDELYDRLYPNG